MTIKRPDDENIHVSARVKAFLKKRAWRERKPLKQIVDDLCFPKGIPVKTLRGV